MSKPFKPIAASTARRQLSETLKADARQREKAKNILRPEVISARRLDAASVLLTTLGGKTRQITEKDLRAFQKSALALGKTYGGGITAKKVILFSTAADKQRSKEQIHTAFPVSNRSGLVQFQTNAGPDSKKTRHQVLVEFTGFTPAVVMPAKSAAQPVRSMVEGPIKIECDCEHWRYVYRYIATVGRFNAGRAETGFPKLKNPHLDGIACKHVLRVMHVVQSPTFGRFAQKMIERARSRVTAKIEDVTTAQVATFIKGAKKDATAAASPKQVALKRSLLTKAKAAVAKYTATLSPREKQAKRNLDNLVRLGVITPEKAKKLLAASSKSKE